VAEPKAPAPAGSVTSQQLAEVFDCTKRMVEKYAEQGIVVRVGRGRYHFLSSVKNLVVHLRKQAALQEGSEGSAVDEGILFRRTQRRLAEIRIAQIEGKLISREEVEEVWAALVLANRQLVLSVATRARLELPHMTGHDQATIQKLCHDILAETALGEGTMPAIKGPDVTAEAMQ
jgi:phage terminase Nu1 subunit (DNA packaging protein)